MSILGKHEVPGSTLMSGLLVRPASARDRDPALRIALQQAREGDRPALLARGLQMLTRGELGLLAAYDADQLVGAMFLSEAPGAVGLVWPPQVRPGFPQAVVEDRLVREAMTRLQAQGVKLCQALLLPEETVQGRSLLRNGFSCITTLLLLGLPVGRLSTIWEFSEQLTFEAFSAPNCQTFEQTLLRTYERTQDCPELNGVRSIDEILAGHQAQGDGDARRWWLALLDGEPVGVLLVTGPLDAAWEIVYLGVIPEARGRRFGRQLVTKSLQEARSAGASQMLVSVDSRNRVALELYEHFGFEPREQREVYLALPSPPQA